ncbi:MAG: hypothetical protein U5L96_02070 [Owenweeksia sp.]|nr:hypothetical protein [Owenweeksia sp.]
MVRIFERRALHNKEHSKLLFEKGKILYSFCSLLQQRSIARACLPVAGDFNLD